MDPSNKTFCDFFMWRSMDYFGYKIYKYRLPTYNTRSWYGICSLQISSVYDFFMGMTTIMLTATFFF